MTEGGAHLRMGIIGGCSSHQHDIPINGLYHRRLAALVAEAGGQRLRVRIVRAFDESYEARLERLLASGDIDLVMVHMRVTIVMRAALLVREQTPGGTRLRLNPAFLHRGHRGRPTWISGDAGFADAIAEGLVASGAAGPDTDAYGGTRPAQDSHPAGRRIAGFPLRELNHGLGRLLGLHRWAIEDELLRLDAFLGTCARRGIPVIVLGPTPATFGRWPAQLMHDFSAAIGKRLQGTGIPYAPVDERSCAGGAPLTRADGIHLTLAGHEAVARTLFRAGGSFWPEPGEVAAAG